MLVTYWCLIIKPLSENFSPDTSAISLWNNEDPSPFFPSEIPQVKKQVVERTVDTEISGIAEEELLQEQVKFAELSL